MEFNIQVNMDWIENEENIDDLVKNAIVREIVNKIGVKITDMLHREAMNAISYSIDSYIDDMLKRFLDRDFIVTDKFGSVTARYLNVEEMLKEKFDEFISGKVDKKTGEANNSKGSCSYSSIDRIEFMLEKLISSRFEDHKRDFDKAAAAIEKRLKEEMVRRADLYMQEKIAHTLTALVDVETK